jgi:hypothetical protein
LIDPLARSTAFCSVSSLASLSLNMA